jgi:hypothetical protein
VARQPRTVLEVCVANLGVHRGAVAAANVAQLALTTSDLGHFPTAVEYAEYWAVIERTAFHHRRRAREGLGDEYQAVVLQLAAIITAKKSRSPRAVMSLPVPRPVAA